MYKGVGGLMLTLTARFLVPTGKGVISPDQGGPQ